MKLEKLFIMTYKRSKGGLNWLCFGIKSVRPDHALPTQPDPTLPDPTRPDPAQPNLAQPEPTWPYPT